MEQTNLEQAGEFMLADLGAASPLLGKKALSDLKAAGRVKLEGRGTRWAVS